MIVVEMIAAVVVETEEVCFGPEVRTRELVAD
jgi:hypothetical protein